ncbi:MAG: double zinc ribbon domain-containing protein [Candidatus Hodarchaeales archaeon]
MFRTCTSCGSIIEINNRHCPHCGIALKQPPKKCEACSTVSPIDANYCDECGHRFLH